MIATAAKNDECEAAVLDGAVQSMLRLNRVAAEVAQEAGAGGATDITGFGLLGHASEMVEASGAGLTLRSRDLPLLPGALALAERGTFSGGMGRNRRYLEDALGARGQLRIDPAVPEALVKLLCESETSGGLLFAVDAGRVAAVRDGFARRGEPVWEVGRGDRGAGAGAGLARGVGALQERDQLLAQLGGQLGFGGLTEAAGGVDGASVGIDEGHAGRASIQVPLQQLGLVSGKGAVDVVGEELDTLRAADFPRGPVHSLSLTDEALGL